MERIASALLNSCGQSELSRLLANDELLRDRAQQLADFGAHAGATAQQATTTETLPVEHESTGFFALPSPMVGDGDDESSTPPHRNPPGVSASASAEASPDNSALECVLTFEMASSGCLVRRILRAC